MMTFSTQQRTTKVQKKDTRGFTLIEALVAISILLLSIGGPMSIAQSGLQNSIHARDQITAFYLAQEGVELVRSVRDDNALASSGGAVDWLNTLTGSSCFTSVNPDGCGINIDTGNIFACTPTLSTNPCDIRYYSPGSERGIYSNNTSGGSATIFSRSIKITTINPQEVNISSVVSWRARGQIKTVTVQSRMLNQYDNLFTP